VAATLTARAAEQDAAAEAAADGKETDGTSGLGCSPGRRPPASGAGSSSAGAADKTPTKAERATAAAAEQTQRTDEVGRCELKPVFEAPDSSALKLNHHYPLSNFAFNFDLHPHIEARCRLDAAEIQLESEAGT
jgi:hypothetical protein